MKKSLLLVSLGLLLVGCGETNNSSVEEKNTLNELLTSLSNKFHTTYQNSEGTFLLVPLYHDLLMYKFYYL